MIQGSNDAFRSSEDFVFRLTPREDILYNPQCVTVVKQVNLKTLEQVVDVLKELLETYKSTCMNRIEKKLKPKKAYEFVRIPGDSVTVTEGIKLCKGLGDDFKLLELITKDEVTHFLS